MGTRVLGWIGRHEQRFDSSMYWWGGASMTAFILHAASDALPLAWFCLGMALLNAALGVTAHVVRDCKHGAL